MFRLVRGRSSCLVFSVSLMKCWTTCAQFPGERMRLRMKIRESWYQKYTNAVLALNQLLKDLQYKEYEKRLKIEDSRKLRRTVLSSADARKLFGPMTRRIQQRKRSSRSLNGKRIG